MEILIFPACPIRHHGVCGFLRIETVSTLVTGRVSNHNKISCKMRGINNS